MGCLLYLLDASAIIGIVLGFSDPDRYLFDRYTIDLAKYESINAIWKLVRRNILTERQGTIFVMKVLSVLRGMKVVAVGVEDFGDILRLALDTGLTVYDSSYLFIAKRLGLKLVTEDRELRSACSLIGVEGLGVDEFIKEVSKSSG